MATMNSLKFQNYNTISNHNNNNNSNNFISNFKNALLSEHSEKQNFKTYNSTNFAAGSCTNFTPTSQSQNQLFFSFKQRSGKLCWKEIMKLDLDQMLKTNDISALEAYLENLVFSSIEANDVEIISENATVKLIKIYQHVLEYLLHTQLRLEGENKAMELSYAQLQSEAAFKENSLKANKSLISSLKKDKKEKESVLSTYKCLMDEYKSGVFSPYAFNNFNNLNNNSNFNNFNLNDFKNSKFSAAANAESSDRSNNNINLSDNKKQYFFCQYCSGKKFSSEENLQNHFQRRHAIADQNAKQNPKSKAINKKNSLANKSENIDLDASELRLSKREYVHNLENQVEELKNLFKNFMKNSTANDSFSKLAENQKALESQISEVQNDKEKMENLMQENFKKTLLEIKEFVINSTNNNNNNFENNNNNLESNYKKIKNESSNAFENEGIEAIKSNIINMNELISEMEKNQNEKIQTVHEQLDHIQNAITTELKDLKTNTINAANNEANSSNGNNRNFANTQSFSENRYNNNNNNRIRGDSMEITNAFSISNLAAEKLDFNRAPIAKKKLILNAGPLESDYSEQESDMKYNLYRNNNVQVIRKNEDEKVSLQKRNENYKNANGSNNKDNKEQQHQQSKLENDRNAIIEVIEGKSEKKVEKVKGPEAQSSTANEINNGDNIYKNKLKQNGNAQIEKAHEISDIASCDIIIDNVSNITKEKNPLKINKQNENMIENNFADNINNDHNSYKNSIIQKQKEDSQIILDNISEDKSQKAEKENRKQTENKNNNNKVNETENKQINESKAKSDNESSEIPFKRNKTMALANVIEKNEIQITNFKNDFKVERFDIESENLDVIKTKFVEQFQEREKQFRMANVDLNCLDLEKDDLDFYKRVL